MERALKKRVVIVGAGGYSGAEALHILLGHPGAQVVGLFGSAGRGDGEKPASISQVFPRFRGRCELAVEASSVDRLLALKPDAAFLATPHEASLELAPALAAAGVVVFDLSAAFRLKDPALYPKHYGFEHHAAGELSRSPYGLVELFRCELRAASIIAVPGCYPTSAILPLAPLVKAGAIEPGRRPIIDSTSGVSGAGRSLALKSLFCEVSQQPYNVFKHRHQPEIDAYAGTPTWFTPHLGQYDRGILSTIHVDLMPGWSEDRVRALYGQVYGREPFIRLLPPGVWPAVKDVQGTNFCDIAVAVNEQHSHAIIVSAIDNLVKGAAGQAVQCFNVRFGFDETTALLDTAPGATGASR